jgi:integrase/recombinase XerD
VSSLFDSYLQHGKYLKSWSPKTAIVYQRAHTSLQQSLQESRDSNPTGATGSTSLSKPQLEAWVMFMRKRELSPACTNIYIRAINSYCTWLYEEKHLPEHLKLKQIPAPVKPVVAFSDADIRLILSFKPSPPELRTWTLLLLLLDTGCRINELLTLRSVDVDMDNCLLTVDGKGSRKRKVPFSIELRKVLFRYGKIKSNGYFFCCRHGSKLMYRNIYRDIIKMCRKVGITKRVHCHLTRHTFACHFMKNGGSIYSLSRILGHSSISTTQTYVRGLGIETFQEEHSRVSPLAHLRS